MLARIAVLEVGAAGPANEECVAREHPVWHDETVGIVSVAGRIDDIERKPLDCERVAVAKPHRHHVGLSLFTHHGNAMGTIAQRPKAGNVVGVQVCVHRFNQPQIQLFHELQVAIDLLQHRIDDQRLAARPAGEQIGVGAGRLIKELAEYHGATLSAADYTNDAGSRAIPP